MISRRSAKSVFFLNARARSMPLMPGIIISRTASWKWLPAAGPPQSIRSASAPFAALPGSNPHARSMSFNIWRFVALSSTTRTLKPLRLSWVVLCLAGPFACRATCCRLEPGGKPEGRPLPLFALHADLSVHHVNQLLRYTQPKARSSESCGWSMNRPARRNRKSALAPPGRCRCPYRSPRSGALPYRRGRKGKDLKRHLSAFRELYGISDKVDDDLPQTRRVAAQAPWGAGKT